jgi:serine/threonine protein kinase, bacterial
MAERARITALIFASFAGLVWAVGGVAQTQSSSSATTAAYTVFASGLNGPRGLLFGPTGELYVAEQNGGTVAKVGPNGDVQRIAKGFSSPHDLAIDREGNLYVADSDNDRIARISTTGQVTTYIDKVPSPVDLDFNPQGELLVCELYKGVVVSFKGGKAVRVVASGLSWPHGLAFGKAGETYINENTGNRIDRVDSNGKLQRFADVERPVGLAFGRSGDLYVAQPQVGKVSRVKPNGTRITLMEGLKQPRDPAFDAAGNLYIAETETGRILKLVGNY